MKHLTILLPLLLFVASFQIHSSSLVVIENVTIIDADNPVRTEMTVVLEDGVIIAIEKSGSDKILVQKEDTLIDGTDKFLIPGLWDAHVHLTFIPEIDYKTSYRLFLSNGITSIRDTGAVLDKLQPAIRYAKENPNITPRLFYSGPLIDGSPSVYTGKEPGYPELSIEINEDIDLEALIEGMVGQGVSFLKTYEMLSKDLFIELLKISEDKNLKVTGHIPLGIDLFQAVDNGLDGMQHIRNLELACSKNANQELTKRLLLLENSESIPGSALRSKIHQSQRYTAIANIDEDRCNKVIKHLADNNVFQTPTLTINTVGSKRFFADKEWQDTYRFLPNKIRNRWLVDSKNLSKQAINKDYKTFEQWSFKVVSLFNKYDVKIIAGTDTPIGFLIPGFSLHKELELLVEAGLTPLQALRAATITPAEFFNMEDKIGTVEVGKYADLVILNNNPLQNIQHTQDIHTVIVKGHIQAFLNQ